MGGGGGPEVPRPPVGTDAGSALAAQGAQGGGYRALRPAPVSPPKATPARVERLLADPPPWLAGSYLPAYRAGRHTLGVLAYAVTAALKLSPYDDDVVDDVAAIMRGLGYRDSCAPPPFEHDLTEFSQGDERRAMWT